MQIIAIYGTIQIHVYILHQRRKKSSRPRVTLIDVLYILIFDLYANDLTLQYDITFYNNYIMFSTKCFALILSLALYPLQNLR